MARKKHSKRRAQNTPDWKTRIEEEKQEYLLNVGEYVVKLYNKYGIGAAKRYYEWRCRDLLHPRGKAIKDIQAAEEYEKQIATSLFFAGYDIRNKRKIDTPLF